MIRLVDQVPNYIAIFLNNNKIYTYTMYSFWNINRIPSSYLYLSHAGETEGVFLQSGSRIMEPMCNLKLYKAMPRIN